MKLFEITTSKYGESYVRCYAWAINETAARVYFCGIHFPEEIKSVVELFDSDEPPFITALSDDGFASKHVIKQRAL